MSPAPITIRLDGQPAGKGRPRFARVNGHAVAYTPAATRAYEKALSQVARLAMGPRAPMEGPIALRAEAHFSVPRSWSGKKRAEALTGLRRPTAKPDADNVIKALGDALNGIVWRDDSQVVEATIVKSYALEPKLLIEVTPL